MSTFCSICFQAEIAQESFWSCGLLTKFRNEHEMRWRNKLQKHRDDYIFPAMIMMQVVHQDGLRNFWGSNYKYYVVWCIPDHLQRRFEWLTHNESLGHIGPPFTPVHIGSPRMHARWEQGLCLGDFCDFCAFGSFTFFCGISDTLLSQSYFFL